jgi:hypothetical protein
MAAIVIALQENGRECVQADKKARKLAVAGKNFQGVALQ